MAPLLRAPRGAVRGRPARVKGAVFSTMPTLTVILNQGFKMERLGANQAFCSKADVLNITG